MPKIPPKVPQDPVSKLLIDYGLALDTQGKVRDIFKLRDGNLCMITTGRGSAFDFILPLQFKIRPRVLNALTIFWGDKLSLTTDLLAYHNSMNLYLPNGLRDNKDLYQRAVIVKPMQPLQFEAVVRGYLSGSGWKSYQKDRTICGIPLPDGLVESGRLPEILFTPTTKSHTGHDEPMSFQELCNLIGDGLANSVRKLAIEIYWAGSQYALSRGIIIADTKFEFAYDETSNILYIIDEILTPDSSRFWDSETYTPGQSQDSYDKQIMRNYLLSLEIPIMGVNRFDDLSPTNPNHMDYVHNQLVIDPNIIERMDSRYGDLFKRLTGIDICSFDCVY